LVISSADQFEARLTAPASAEVPFTGKGMALNLHEALLVRETNDIIGCSLKAFKETHGENTRDR
jgi:hypothetical protein